MKVETGRFLIVDCFWFVFISTLQKEGDQWSCYFKFAAAGGADEERPTGAEPELTHNPQRGFRVLKTTSDQRLCFPYPSYAYVPRIKTKKKHQPDSTLLRNQRLRWKIGNNAEPNCCFVPFVPALARKMLH